MYSYQSLPCTCSVYSYRLSTYPEKRLITAAAELVATLRALEVHTAAFSQQEAHLTLRAVCNKNEPENLLVAIAMRTSKPSRHTAELLGSVLTHVTDRCRFPGAV